MRLQFSEEEGEVKARLQIGEDRNALLPVSGFDSFLVEPAREREPNNFARVLVVSQF